MPTGADSYVNYGFESSYGTTASATKVFGVGVKLTDNGFKNNLKEFYGLGSRNYGALVDSKFEHSISVEFLVSNPWFLYAVLGTTPSATGEGPYTWTFSEANVPPSLTITNGINLSSDAVMTYTGCVCNSCKISCDSDGPASVTLDLLCNRPYKATTGIGSQVAETEVPFPFAYNTWDLGSSAITTTQSVEVSIENNAELVYGLGSRFGYTPVFKQRKYSISLVNMLTDASVYLEKVFGAATGPTPAITSATTAEANLILDNGGSTTAQRKYTFAFTNLRYESDSVPQAVEDIIIESVDGIAQGLTVTVINNTDAMP